MAVVSARLYANNLHLAPDRLPHQHTIAQLLQAGCSSWRLANSVKARRACMHARTHARTHTHTHSRLMVLFPALPRWASTRKVKPIWILLKQGADSEWQWHQLGHMQVCTLLQTDNHTSTPPLGFLQTGCPSCHPTNSIKALKAKLNAKKTCGTKSTDIPRVLCISSSLSMTYQVPSAQHWCTAVNPVLWPCLTICHTHTTTVNWTSHTVPYVKKPTKCQNYSQTSLKWILVKWIACLNGYHLSGPV